MRKFLTGVFLVISIVALAQERDMNDVRDDRKNNNLKKQEVMFNYGDALVSMNYTTSSSYYYYDYYSYEYYPYYSADWFAANTYRSRQSVPGTFSLSYHSRLGNLKWLWMGANVIYSGAYGGDSMDAYDNHLVSKGTKHLFGIAPSIRFSYLNREKVTLYSGMSLGLLGVVGYSSTNRVQTSINPYFQFTFFGASFGSTVFGNIELGVGHKGVINVGIGYRF